MLPLFTRRFAPLSMETDQMTAIDEILADCDARNIQMMLLRVPMSSFEGAKPWRATFAFTNNAGLKIETQHDAATASAAIDAAWEAFPHTITMPAEPTDLDDEIPF